MARYIDADKMVSKDNAYTTFPHDLAGCDDNDLVRWINEQPTADVVPRAELAVKSFQDAATIDALNKKLAAATEALKYILSDLKKEIHDKAVYPHLSGVEPYISLKVFDAVINKLIGS
jgi:hypothetical protein